MPFIVTPHFEWLQALTDLEQGAATGEAASAWRSRTRRRLDQALLRQLFPLAGRVALWDALSALPIGDDIPVILDQLEARAALSGAEHAALRKFDRLAFTPLWRGLLPDFDNTAAAAPASGDEAVVIPTAFLPRRLIGNGKDVHLLPLDQIGVTRGKPAPATRASPRSTTATADPALVFGALGDATRYAIAGLIAREPLTAADLARRLGVATPTITYHLHRLRAAGLVVEVPRGNSVLLSLDRPAIAAISELTLSRFFGTAEGISIRRSRRPSGR